MNGNFPVDEHDRALLSHVRPPEWRNPPPAEKYDLVVLGGGTAGLVTAAIATALGARVALAERQMLGGDCLNVGCVPSKAMLRAARGWQAAREAHGRFGGPAAAGKGDFAAAMLRMRRIRAEISHHDGADRFSDLGVDVFLGEARFTSDDSVSVDGARLVFRRAVIATGSRPAAPPIDGLEEVGFLTNETVFALTELPEHLVVIGGGTVGCELAQAFARFGSRVTVLEVAPRILAGEDAEAAALVANSLGRVGVQIVAGAKITRVESTGSERRLHFTVGEDSRTLSASHLLIAAGRAPNVESLNAEAAGIEVSARAGVSVDARLRTSNRRVYAIGDVADQPHKFTHAADAHARMVVQNAFFFGRGRHTDLVVPRCTYTSPEVAHVGISAAEAESRSGTVDTLTIDLRDVDRSRLDGETEGYLRLHLDGKDRILGATLVAEHAGDIISHLATAITAGVGLDAIGKTVFPYPTVAEVLRKAADTRRRRKLTPAVAATFSRYFSLTRW